MSTTSGGSIHFSFGKGELSARFTSFPHDAQCESCVLCTTYEPADPDFLTEEQMNIITRLKKFWRDNLDKSCLPALAQQTYLLYREAMLENDLVGLDAQGILNHFVIHTCDDLNAHSVLNIAQSFVSRSILAVNSEGLRDRGGKRVSDANAAKAMQNLAKTFTFLREKRESLIAIERRVLR